MEVKLFNLIALHFKAHSQLSIGQQGSMARKAKIPGNKDRYPVYQRESARITGAWKKSLSDEEIRRIRESVEPLASHFYGEDDW